jgi:protein-disulfide isomerase
MTKFAFILALSVVSSIPGGFAFGADKSREVSSIGATVLVEIDGSKLTLADYERKHPSGLFQARNNFYQAEVKAVEQFIDEYLLEQQAKKENVTVAELLQRHVNSAAGKDPPEDALRIYYEGVDTTEPYEKVRGQIIDHIRESRIAKAQTAYMRSLRSQAHVALHIGPPRAQVDVKDTPIRGLPNAPVVVVEYADYECPYCQQAEPALSKMQADYKGKVAFVYKDVPLPTHTRAQKASEAAHCAGAQGKYWEYHDLLFSSKQLEVPQLKQHALELKLDTAAFDKCLDSGEKSEVVKSQLAQGMSLGLQGTPSFFINGRFFSGGLNYDQLRAVVEEEVAASTSRAKESAIAEAR